MALMPEEKSLAETAYQRLRRSKYGWAGFAGGFVGSIPVLSQSMIKHIEDPHSSHRSIAIFSCLLGLFYGMAIISAVVFSRQRKQDEKLVRFFEREYPDECSWKQEEKILAQAEDLRLKAKVDSLIRATG